MRIPPVQELYHRVLQEKAWALFRDLNGLDSVDQSQPSSKKANNPLSWSDLIKAMCFPESLCCRTCQESACENGIPSVCCLKDRLKDYRINFSKKVQRLNELVELLKERANSKLCQLMQIAIGILEQMQAQLMVPEDKVSFVQSQFSQSLKQLHRIVKEFENDISRREILGELEELVCSHPIMVIAKTMMEERLVCTVTAATANLPEDRLTGLLHLNDQLHPVEYILVGQRLFAVQLGLVIMKSAVVTNHDFIDSWELCRLHGQVLMGGELLYSNFGCSLVVAVPFRDGKSVQIQLSTWDDGSSSPKDSIIFNGFNNHPIADSRMVNMSLTGSSLGMVWACKDIIRVSCTQINPGLSFGDSILLFQISDPQISYDCWCDQNVIGFSSGEFPNGVLYALSYYEEERIRIHLSLKPSKEPHQKNSQILPEVTTNYSQIIPEENDKEHLPINLLFTESFYSCGPPKFERDGQSHSKLSLPSLVSSGNELHIICGNLKIVVWRTITSSCFKSETATKSRYNWLRIPREFNSANLSKSPLSGAFYTRNSRYYSLLPKSLQVGRGDFDVFQKREEIQSSFTLKQKPGAAHCDEEF